MFRNLFFSPKQIGFLAFGLAILGMGLLFLWPSDSSYAPMQASAITIARDGQWVQYAGLISSMVKKTDGYSIRVCDEDGGCATAYVASNTPGALDVDAKNTGMMVRVSGEVSSVSGGGKFVRAHKIEII